MSIKIHELPADPGKRQKRKRVGRGEGSGLGRQSGKGNKGAQARSGGAKGGTFEGGQTSLMRRVPKYGFSNERFRVERGEVRLSDLDKFEDGSTVDLEALYQAGIVQRKVKEVKVIRTGELTRKLTVKANGFTAGARQAIEAAGGTCEVIGK